VIFPSVVLAGLAVTLMLPVVPARADEPVFVPSFVDPGHHTEKPDLGGLRTIRFMTTDDYPPFNFTAPDGSPTGFNVDLARAICDELKVACSIQMRGWDTLVAALQANAGDAVAASLAITAQTRTEVEFSMPTMKTPARFAARAGGAPPGILPETIGKAKVGVQMGTAHAAYLKAFFPQAVVKTYTDPDSLRVGLKAGEIDLMFADGLSTALWLNGTGAANCCRFVGGPFTEGRYFGDGTGIAVRKGDVLLRHAFDFALERLAARGVMADLYLKYFPVGFF
jgi:polar amino acid transport system substrate-binding protein